jgi:hypothetical protein
MKNEERKEQFRIFFELLTRGLNFRAALTTETIELDHDPIPRKGRVDAQAIIDKVRS